MADAPTLEPGRPRRRVSRRGRRWRRGAPPDTAGAPTPEPAPTGRSPGPPAPPPVGGCGPGWPGSAPSGPAANPVLEPLFRVVRQTHPKADLRIIERAYEVAELHHRGQLRKSGDPYITHPLAVTTILAELGMTPPTLCAALLHDTVEDTAVHARASCARDFGDEVAHLVDGVTKLDKVKYGESAQAETVRKMVVAMARDIRVLVIKLADRLHNMRTIRYLQPGEAGAEGPRDAGDLRPAGPPARHEHHQVGARGPRVRDALPQGLRRDRPAGHRPGAEPRRLPRPASSSTSAATSRAPRSAAQVTGRPKHYYSIYQKMIVRGRDFADIYDLVGIRVLVDSVRDCYAALGAIHARWNPVPGRFKDYIAMPKFNMYQSLHTTVIGPEGKPVELQIRTFAMHRRAEYGVAAHWKYKEDPADRRPTVARRTRGDGEPTPARQRHGLAAPAARLAEGDRGPGGVPREPALRPQVGRGLRLHAQGRRHRAAGRRDAGRLRLRRAHRGRPPHASARGSTAGWCRWRARSTTATWSRSSPPRRRAPGPAATG